MRIRFQVGKINYQKKKKCKMIHVWQRWILVSQVPKASLKTAKFFMEVKDEYNVLIEEEKILKQIILKNPDYCGTGTYIQR